MENSTEKNITKLEAEVDAQKVAFEKQASQLPVYTKSIQFTTQENSITMTPIDFPDQPFTTEGNERVVVTFTTDSGANTLATLEVSSDNNFQAADFSVTRVPYSGGARWIVSAIPRYDQSLNRIDTHYTFMVHSVMDGTLEAKMIWE